MKILIVNTFYYPNMQGGAEQSVKLLAEGLAKKGNEVAIFCIDSKNGENSIEEYNNVKVYRHTAHKFNLYKFSYNKDKVGKFEKIMQKIRCYYNKEVIDDFKKVCEEFKPDVVHTNSIYGMSSFIWKTANKLNVPVVHTIRDISIVSPVQYGHKCKKIVKIAHGLYMKKMTKYVSGVTAPSNYTLSTSLETNCFKNTVIKECIFNSVSVDIDKVRNIIDIKKKNQSEIIKFMYAGRLVYFKGIEHMIKAFMNIKNEKCELHICGDGEMRNFVEDSVKKDNRIIFHGKLKNEELAQCYEDCDVLIVPSFWPEPFGRVLIEGNMYGLPVIAGNCGGMPEIIENTKAGIVYEPGNEESLKNKMLMLYDRKNIKKYYDNILENIKIYDIKEQIKKFENLYINLKGE